MDRRDEAFTKRFLAMANHGRKLGQFPESIRREIGFDYALVIG